MASRVRVGPHPRKKVPDRDGTRLLLSLRQRAAEQAEREPRRRSITPDGCLACGDPTQPSFGSVCRRCADHTDLKRRAS